MTLVSKYCRTGKPSPFQNRASSWAAAFTKTEVDELPLILAMLMPVAPDRFEMGMERAGPTLVVGSTSQVRVRPVRVFTKICMVKSTTAARHLSPKISAVRSPCSKSPCDILSLNQGLLQSSKVKNPRNHTN